MRNTVLSLEALLKGNAIVEAPDTFDDGAFSLVASIASARMSADHAEDMRNAESGVLPGARDAYLVKLPPWIPAATTKRVVEAFAAAGFPHTKVWGDTLAIARCEYVPAKGQPLVAPAHSGPHAHHQTSTFAPCGAP